MASRSNSIPRICACGCNGVIRGGEFKPGHDAKLRGHFLRRIDNGDEKAIAEFLNERPKLAYPYGYTEAKLRDRLEFGRRRSNAVQRYDRFWGVKHCVEVAVVLVRSLLSPILARMGNLRNP